MGATNALHIKNSTLGVVAPLETSQRITHALEGRVKPNSHNPTKMRLCTHAEGKGGAMPPGLTYRHPSRKNEVTLDQSLSSSTQLRHASD
jgi:hypothetical protein